MCVFYYLILLFFLSHVSLAQIPSHSPISVATSGAYLFESSISNYTNQILLFSDTAQYHFGVSSSNHTQLSEIGHRNLSFARTQKNLSYGVSVSNFGYHHFSFTESKANLAHRVSSNLFLGGSLSYLYSNIINDDFHYLTFEFYLRYVIHPRLTLTTSHYNPFEAFVSSEPPLDFQWQVRYSNYMILYQVLTPLDVYFHMHSFYQRDPIYSLGGGYRLFPWIKLLFSTDSEFQSYGSGVMLSYHQIDLSLSFNSNALLGQETSFSLGYRR